MSCQSNFSPADAVVPLGFRSRRADHRAQERGKVMVKRDGTMVHIDAAGRAALFW